MDPLFFPQGPSRTSNMDAPIMLLTGHEGEIYSAKFHPDGNFLASAGFDRNICTILTLGMIPVKTTVA